MWDIIYFLSTCKGTNKHNQFFSGISMWTKEIVKDNYAPDHIHQRMLSRSKNIFCSLAKHLYSWVFLTDCTFSCWIDLLLLYKYWIEVNTVAHFYYILFILLWEITDSDKNGCITKSLRFDGISLVISCSVMSISILQRIRCITLIPGEIHLIIQVFHDFLDLILQVLEVLL